MASLRIALITRLRTPNKGNEALSSECIRALRQDPRVSAVELLDRVPPYTLRFSVRHLRRTRSIDEQVTKWSLAAGKLERSADRKLESLSSEVTLDERNRHKDPLLALKRRIPIRSWLARLGTFDAEYGRRLRLIRSCGTLILNAAGEFWENAVDTPLRHLLDMHFAQATGCRTAIINHTFSLRDPTVLQLASLVYRKLDYVSVRDVQSRDAIEALGVDRGRIAVTPDLVFLTDPIGTEAASPGRVALCPNTSFRPSLQRDWGRLIEALQLRNIGCALCSNDFPTDGELIRVLSARYNVPVVGQGLGYREYAGLLGKYEAIVSGRLHTGILAITASTPVIPIEGLTFKITAAMREVENPFIAVDFDRSGWLERTLAMVDSAIRDHSLRRATHEIAQRQQRLARDSVGQLIDELASDASITTGG